MNLLLSIYKLGKAEQLRAAKILGGGDVLSCNPLFLSFCLFTLVDFPSPLISNKIHFGK